MRRCLLILFCLGNAGAKIRVWIPAEFAKLQDIEKETEKETPQGETNHGYGKKRDTKETQGRDRRQKSRQTHTEGTERHRQTGSREIETERDAETPAELRWRQGDSRRHRDAAKETNTIKRV